MISLIAARTNTMSPRWDAHYYIDMAKSGLIGNPNLVAPFAYRPGMPFLSRAVSTVLSIPIERGFRIVGGVSALCLLLSIFMLARCFTVDFRHAIMPMILLGFSFSHIKFPFFFYSLVDVAAYPIMVVAFWALITKRIYLCLFVSALGILFKEFLVVPLLLLFIHLGCEFWRTRSRLNLIRLSVALVVGAGVIFIPRIFLHVNRTFQFVDPINDISTLGNLISAPLDEYRMFNILYNLVGYWLPTILLITRPRFNLLLADLQRFNIRVLCGLQMFLVLLLTLYGGTNIEFFIGYSVAVQVVVLALLYRNGVGVAETLYAIGVMLFYNKIMRHIPSPSVSLDNYIDFYGGWASRVTMTTIVRFLECGMFVALAAFIRRVAADISSDRLQSDSKT